MPSLSPWQVSTRMTSAPQGGPKGPSWEVLVWWDSGWERHRLGPVSSVSLRALARAGGLAMASHPGPRSRSSPRPAQRLEHHPPANQEGCKLGF